jgi:hypothetical protein
MDGHVFDPSNMMDYVRDFAVRSSLPAPSDRQDV